MKLYDLFLNSLKDFRFQKDKILKKINGDKKEEIEKNLGRIERVINEINEEILKLIKEKYSHLEIKYFSIENNEDDLLQIYAIAKNPCNEQYEIEYVIYYDDNYDSEFKVIGLIFSLTDKSTGKSYEDVHCMFFV
jgi:hypothetical protein